MLKLLKKATLGIILFFFSLPFAHAQYEVGLFVGVSNHQGDLTGNLLKWQETQPGFGVLVRFTPTPYLTIRGNYLQGKLTGSDYRSVDPATRYRGFSFQSTIREFSFLGEFNFLGQNNEKSYDRGGFLFNPYIFGGVGVASNDGTPTAPPDTRPYPFPEEGAKSIIPALPMGFGVKMQFGETVSVGVEWGTRLTFSDYLDGISKAGNPKKDDWYMFGGLTLTYCFGNEY